MVSNRLLCTGALCVAAGAAVSANAAIDGANVHTRLWNDAPNSTLTVTNNYPSSIAITDHNVTNGVGYYANRHNFRLSTGGVDATFANGMSFAYSADVRLDGPGYSEGGLSVSPWWSQQYDGTFMLKTAGGEIAVFGGRLPFYSFTAASGLHYTAGTTVHCGITYNAHSLSALDPATIEYSYTDGSGTYSSGPLAFDEGNPAEGYGSWGMLNNAMVGGYYQPYVDNFVPDASSGATFSNISFVPAPGAMALIGLAGLAAGRRRR